MVAVSAVAPVIGAVGSGVSAIFGNRQAQNNALMNYYLSIMERQAEDVRQFNQRMDAERIRRDQQLGVTDSRGNRTHFVPGVGVVTDLEPGTRTRQELSDIEEQRRLSLDQDLRREQLNEQASDQGRQGEVADSLLEAFLRTTRGSVQDQRAENFANASRGVSTATNAALQPILTQRLRGGTSDNSDVYASIADRQANTLADAFMQAGALAEDQVASRFNNDRGNLASLYDMFQSRSTTPLGTTFTPDTSALRAENNATPVAQRSLSGDSALMQSSSPNAFRVSRFSTTPDTTIADAIGGTGFALGGHFAGLEAGRRFDDLLSAFLSQSANGVGQGRGGNPNLGNVGAF